MGARDPGSYIDRLAGLVYRRDRINRKLIQDALRADEEAGETSPRIRRDQP